MISLPGITISQNQWDKLHHMERYKIRTQWFWTVKAVMGRKSPLCQVPATLKICRVAKRLVDLPNITSATKPLIDALVEYQWLAGDGPEDLTEFSVTQRKPKPGEDECMEVSISYLQP